MIKYFILFSTVVRYSEKKKKLPFFIKHVHVFGLFRFLEDCQYMRFSLFKGKTVKEKNIFSNRSSHYVKVKKDMHCKNKTLWIKVEIKN